MAILVISGCAVSPDKQATSFYIDDDIITSTIKTRHAESQDLAKSRISVETLYGVVLLSGETKNSQQKMTAQQLAEQVEGVKAVHNQILIQTDSFQSDSSQTDTGKRNTAASVQVRPGIEL